MQSKPQTRDSLNARLLHDSVIANPYIPHTPHPKQALFLAEMGEEAFFGGAAGPGKSDGILMAALQCIQLPGYSALLIRQTMPQLEMPGGLVPRSHEWLGATDATWNGQRRQWSWPNNATLTFGHMEHEKDKYRYQGSEFDFVGFDELTHFSETQYLYLFSRLRSAESSIIPSRMRAGSNPGGRGHEWVKRRFIDPGHPDRPFIRAVLSDNPSINREDYIKKLMHLDPITRERLLSGDWDVVEEGTMFRRHWFSEIVDDAPADCTWIRWWDLAATEPKAGKDPDYTVGAKLGMKDGIFWLADIKRDRLSPKDTEDLIKQTAQLDGIEVRIGLEQEGGASGKSVVDYYRRDVLPGFVVDAKHPTGSKSTRAAPWASAAEAGNIKLVSGPWIDAFLDEVTIFPAGSHDDQVDAVSGAYENLTEGYIYPSVSYPGQARKQLLDTEAEIDKLLREIDDPALRSAMHEEIYE